MKKRALVVCLCSLFVIEVIALVVFATQKTESPQDAVAVNEVAESVRIDWQNMEKHKNRTGLDYVVLDADRTVRFRTKTGLSESINEAVMHRDTILDVEVNHEVVGKLIVYNDSTSETESTETEIKKYKQVYVPGFWARAGSEVSEAIDGQVGINRGYLAGSWKITEKGIVSTTATSFYGNRYYGESKAYLGEDAATEAIPSPQKNKEDGNYYLKVNDSLSLQLSQRNYAVQLLSFNLPNQIGRAIGLWDGDSNFTYAYQRIVAGKYRETKNSQFKELNVKEWAWELLDDGSMYARRAVLSTNREKTYENTRDGVYIGPEGISVGKFFQLNKEGAIIKGPTPITAIEIVSDTKYNVTTNGGVEYYNARLED